MIDSQGAQDHAFVDFAPYAPSNGVAAAFLLVPVRDGDTFAGVMASNVSPVIRILLFSFWGV